MTAAVPYEHLTRRFLQLFLSIFGLALAYAVYTVASFGMDWVAWLLAAVFVLPIGSICYVWGFHVALWVRVEPSGLLAFRAPFRSGSLAIREITSFKSAGYYGFFHKLYYPGKKMRLPGVENTFELISALREHNPSMKVEITRGYLRIMMLSDRAQRTWPFRIMHRILPDDENKQDGSGSRT